MKKILCLIDSLGSGGAQRQMVGLASLLQHNGYSVKLITYFDIPFYLTQLQNCGVEYEYVNCGSSVLKRLQKLDKAIYRFRPDVVISYLDTPNILSCLLHIRNRKKWKLIVSERNTTQSLTLREKIKFSLYRFADFIVSNSYSQDAFIKRNYPQYFSKCNVITNFVDTSSFSPSNSHESDGVLRIIGVGRVLRQKNIPMLIKAVKLLDEKGCNCRVDWYGSRFDAYDECMSLIMQLKLGHAFIFHDPCSNIIDKYHHSDIFVLPSIFEGFPNVLCEAMSCGLPVIATNVCDNGKIVQDNENGYLVSSGEAVQLAEKLIQFINLSPEERAEMGAKSRAIAVNLFSKESFVNKYVKLLD